jgi:hypothetical protein
MVAHMRKYGDPAVVFPCLLGWSIDARQNNVSVSVERGEQYEQYDRKHDTLIHLALVV